MFAMKKQKQLIVATIRGGESRKIEQILACLEKHPEGLSPKLISLYSKINVNTVKTLLPKIEQVKNPIRGLYLVVKGGDAPPLAPSIDLTPWTFHNLHLSTETSFKPRKMISTTFSCKINNYKFVISTVGRITFSFATPQVQNISSIGLTGLFFAELVFRYTGHLISMRDINIDTIEFNRDYTNLRLDGVKCITLDELQDQFKLYQKKLCLRKEHKTKVRFTAQDIIDMLTSNPNSLDIHTKLNAQGEQLADLQRLVLEIARAKRRD